VYGAAKERMDQRRYLVRSDFTSRRQTADQLALWSNIL